MKSKWRASAGTESHGAPVEMRFIDMFMTALGALLFLALLLAVLISQLGKGENNPDTGEIDRNVVRRQVDVMLAMAGCNPSELTTYFRYAGPGRLHDFETKKDTGESKPFDASNPFLRSSLAAARHYATVQGMSDAAFLRALPVRGYALDQALIDKNALQFQLISFVSSSASPYELYIGFVNPPIDINVHCAVQPIYFSKEGITYADTISLTRHRPFAWLRRFRIDNAGDTTLKKEPKDDAEFTRDLTDFSRKQSEKLCTAKQLCETEDAHLAVLATKAKSPIMQIAFDGKPDSYFKNDGYKSENNATYEKCLEMCREDDNCQAIEYGGPNKRCQLHKALSATLKQRGVQTAEKVTRQATMAWSRGHFQIVSYSSERGLSRNMCENACLDDFRCQAVEWWPRENFCMLLDKTAKASLDNNTLGEVALKELGPPKVATVAIDTPPPATMKRTEKTYFAQKGDRVERVANLQQCEQICMADPQCAAIDLILASTPKEQLCHLFSNVPIPSTRRTSERASLSIKDVSRVKFDWKRDMGYPSAGFTSMILVSPAECEAACLKEPRCRAIEFAKLGFLKSAGNTGGRCYLHDVAAIPSKMPYESDVAVKVGGKQ